MANQIRCFFFFSAGEGVRTMVVVVASSVFLRSKRMRALFSLMVKCPIKQQK